MEAATVVHTEAVRATPPGAQPGSPMASESRTAAKVLLAVGALGVVVTGLTWRVADVGLGWLATDVVLVAAVLLGVGRGRPRLAEGLLAAASVWLAGMTAWRASDWAIATALPGSLVTLGLLALVSARRLAVTSLDTVGLASLQALRALPGGIVDAARTPMRAVGAGARGHLLGVVRGAAVGVPLAAVFTLLLSADERFREAVERVWQGTGAGGHLAAWTLVTSLGLLVAYAVLRRLERLPDTPSPSRTGHWPALLPYRGDGDAPGPALMYTVVPSGPRVRPLTWGVVLGPMVAVFGVYAGVHGASLFEGHDHLRAAGTTTYALYLHQGFYQVSIATLLAVACVVVGHALLRPRDGSTRLAGGKAIAAIEVALLALVGVTLASCAHRLALYEEAYGYTYLRLGVWVLQLGVGGLLAMTIARCVARGWRGWGTSLVWSGIAFGVFASTIDADGWIAERNVARPRDGIGLDIEYLTSLSEDARRVLPAITAIDLDAASLLDDTWARQAQAHRGSGWRAMRGIGARGR
jgi:Domain of unknown function (DUF4173)